MFFNEQKEDSEFKKKIDEAWRRFKDDPNATIKFTLWVNSELQRRGFHYKIPFWCRMSIYDHLDGCGGCWGISSGKVADQGIEYCKECEFCEEEVKDEGYISVVFGY